MGRKQFFFGSKGRKELVCQGVAYADAQRAKGFFPLSGNHLEDETFHEQIAKQKRAMFPRLAALERRGANAQYPAKS